MSYISHNAVIMYRSFMLQHNRVLASITLLAFQGILLFYTPCQTAVSGMSPVQSVSHVPGLHHHHHPHEPAVDRDGSEPITILPITRNLRTVLCVQ
jgi:hypothetical protein